MIYCSPKFGEGWLGRGMGLGNRLFPWARCRIHANTATDTVVVSPVWLRPAFGQLLRGGVDYRSYLRQIALLGLFKARAGDLGVVAGFLKTRKLPLVDEATLAQWSAAAPGVDAKVSFRGYEGFFGPLNGHAAFLLDELRAITRPKYLAIADRPARIPVAMCIRCGNDFAEPEQNAAVLQAGEKTPLSWFIRSLELLRRELGYPVSVHVVSDGTAAQLRPLLAMDNVVFVRPGSAISDLLILARAEVLLVSGSSSFAAWGAFLGQMPAASHPGQPLSDWHIAPERGQFLGEFNPAEPAPEFLGQVRARLARAPGAER